jgi:hypothetical protein
MKHRCPVCMYESMPYPASDYNICPCCSTEFGNDDSAFSHRQLREIWIASGANWFFGAPPEHWNPWMQLLRASVPVKPLFTALRFDNNAVIKGTKIKWGAEKFELCAAV